MYERVSVKTFSRVVAQTPAGCCSAHYEYMNEALGTTNCRYYPKTLTEDWVLHGDISPRDLVIERLKVFL
jgi:hypothetical protein